MHRIFWLSILVKKQNLTTNMYYMIIVMVKTLIKFLFWYIHFFQTLSVHNEIKSYISNNTNPTLS